MAAREARFREVRPNDVLERAQALLSQRYRVGSPVLISPALTRAQRSCGQDGRARKGDLKTLTPTSLATSHLGRKRLFMKPIDPLRAHSQENFAAGVSTAREPALLQQASLPFEEPSWRWKKSTRWSRSSPSSTGQRLRRFLRSRVRNAADIPDVIQEVFLRLLRAAVPRNDPRGRGLHLHLVYARRPDNPARHPPAAP